MYNTFWWFGSILASWAAYGSNLHLENSWAWRVPTLLQAALPSLVMCCIMFFPESPRWLIAEDRTEEAIAIFAKFHGDGDLNAPIVKLQYQEIIAQMAQHRNENP
jgi:MFS family permease